MGMGKELYGKPLISVVMCSYNGLPYIKEAVSCIVNQTYSNWELIISDDGSTDGSRDWLRENLGQDSRVKLFFQETNLGYVANKNFVHREAKGEYITQLDNDDLCAHDKLEKQLRVFETSPHIKIVACGYLRIDKSGDVYGCVSSGSDTVIESTFEDEYPFWFPGLMVHRSVFQTIGYYNEYFAGALGDDLYWTKSANQSNAIYCLAEPLYSYRNNPNSITNVFGNIRKLLMPEIIKILLRQQKETGEDWLTKNDFQELKREEYALENNRVFMSEQYRLWATRAIDKNDKQLSQSLLWKSFKKNPMNLKVYRTLVYFLRR